jgi:hypothetical protein
MMAEAFIPHDLNGAVRQFHSLKSLAERAMVQINDEALFTALDEEANSIAALLRHTAGNVRARWTDFPTVADETPDRLGGVCHWFYGGTFLKRPNISIDARVSLPSPTGPHASTSQGEP